MSQLPEARYSSNGVIDGPAVLEPNENPKRVEPGLPQADRVHARGGIPLVDFHFAHHAVVNILELRVDTHVCTPTEGGTCAPLA